MLDYLLQVFLIVVVIGTSHFIVGGLGFEVAVVSLLILILLRLEFDSNYHW